MALQLTGGVPSGVAGTGTTAMAGTALGIAVFDLLLRNRGLGGDGGIISGFGGGVETRHESAQIATLRAEQNAQREITRLEIELSKERLEKENLRLRSEFDSYKALNEGVALNQERKIRFLENVINLTPALSTSAVHPD